MSSPMLDFHEVKERKEFEGRTWLTQFTCPLCQGLRFRDYGQKPQDVLGFVARTHTHSVLTGRCPRKFRAVSGRNGIIVACPETLQLLYPGLLVRNLKLSCYSREIVFFYIPMLW